MFEDVLLESAKHSPGQQRTLSAAASLVLQTALLAAFVLAPLFARNVVPDLGRTSPPVWLPLPPPPTVSSEEAPSGSGASAFVSANELRQPPQVPTLNRDAVITDVAPVSIGQDRSLATNGLLNSLFGNNSGNGLPENVAVKRPPVSVLEQGIVLSRVQPVYPPLAIQNRIQGSVHVNAVIAANGNLEGLRVVDGHPMLVRSALDAVRQWRFRPYILNGEPIEVQTEITVNFSLN